LGRFSLAPGDIRNCSHGVIQCFNQQALPMCLLFVAPGEQTTESYTTEASRKRDEGGEGIH